MTYKDKVGEELKEGLLKVRFNDVYEPVTSDKKTTGGGKATGGKTTGGKETEDQSKSPESKRRKITQLYL